MLRKLPVALALAAALGTAACTDPYGRPDPLATGLLGGGVGAAAGLAIASANQPRRQPSWGGDGVGWHHPPRQHWGQHQGQHRGQHQGQHWGQHWGHGGGWHQPRPHWGHARHPGWGHGGWGHGGWGHHRPR